jgi:DNA primase
MPAGSIIVAATDKDKAGEAFAKSISELCAKHSHVTYERHAPRLGKDWNDHLQALRCQTRSVGGETKRHQGLQR